jgi:hypothetical protein
MATSRVNRIKVALKLDFERRVLLQLRGSTITSDAGLLPNRELDDNYRSDRRTRYRDADYPSTT